MLLLSTPLTGDATRFWPAANPHVLWGWKRDDGAHSRTVYFSARLRQSAAGIVLAPAVFFYKHRCPRAEATAIADELSRLHARELDPIRLELRHHGPAGFATVVLTCGAPAADDQDRIRRLQLRRPRRSLGAAPAVAPRPLQPLTGVFPADLYAGSGVSYEAGIPTLCDMHDAFGVDDHERETFAFGGRDSLPRRLAHDPEGTLRAFCRVHVAALWAEPTAAQRSIAELWRRSAIGLVLSDNVDNLLAKVGVPFVRTRGSGVFNERFPVRFTAPTLVVVGVAADRRQIVRQARAQGVRVVVVDPRLKVSPRVQQLNYLRSGDTFFQTTADAFFAAVRERLAWRLPENGGDLGRAASS